MTKSKNNPLNWDLNLLQDNLLKLLKQYNNVNDITKRNR